MARPDLNLLIALDVLLETGCVAKAASRLQLSQSAMSRTLARLRETTGDPLLVRSGRGLVATPRALELRERVGQVVVEAEAVLRPAAALDLAELDRTFTLRTRDGFVETFGPALIERVRVAAPRVRLRFVHKLDKQSGPLREGLVDLETGVLDPSIGPELRTQALFRDRMIGVVRAGHPLTHGRLTAARYASGEHIESAQQVAQRGAEPSAIDLSLASRGLEREIVAIVAGFSTAIALARGSDLIASVPERHTANLRAGMHSFALPFAVPAMTVSLLWHPRLDADPAHRWLRACVREAVAQ